MPETTLVHPAHTLKKGSRIKFRGEEVTLSEVQKNDDWVTLYFETLVWNPLTEQWTLEYGCHFGFCFEVVEN